MNYRLWKRDKDITETIPAKLVQLVHEDIDELVLRLLINLRAVL